MICYLEKKTSQHRTGPLHLTFHFGHFTGFLCRLSYAAAEIIWSKASTVWIHLWQTLVVLFPFGYIICVTNISPDNWWLEDDPFPFKMVPFQETFIHFLGRIKLGHRRQQHAAEPPDFSGADPRTTVGWQGAMSDGEQLMVDTKHSGMFMCTYIYMFTHKSTCSMIPCVNCMYCDIFLFFCFFLHVTL